MKTLLILSANLCFIASFAQARTTTKKVVPVIENKEVFNAVVKEDTLNTIRTFSSKKIPINLTPENNQEAIDTTTNSKSQKTTTSKK